MFVLNQNLLKVLPLIAAGLLTQCAKTPRHDSTGTPLVKALDKNLGRNFQPSAALRARILALDPNHVTEADVQNTLAACPAPRAILIHGGIHPVQFAMIDFAEFLVAMGYPKSAVTFPDGTISFSCYENSTKMVGAVGYYYERDGMRPLLISHSQGGFNIIRILNDLTPKTKKLKVFNPVSWSYENRTVINDPLTGQSRPVGDLSIAFASPVGSGGVTRLLPNTYDTLFNLHSVPGAVDAFTAYPKENDLLGGDFLGYGPTNNYRKAASAVNTVLRNVWLPANYTHGWTVYVKHNALQKSTRAWINAYQQKSEILPPHPTFADSRIETRGILWAADIWVSIKRAWVKELQTLVRATSSTPAS